MKNNLQKFFRLARALLGPYDADRMAFALDANFPAKLRTDSFARGELHNVAEAERNRDGTYRLVALRFAGGGVPRMMPLHGSADLPIAIHLLHEWSEAQAKSGSIKEHDAGADARGVHYRKAATLLDITL